MFESSSPGEIGFSIGRIPVRIQPMFWLITVMLGFSFVYGPDEKTHDPIKLLAWLVIVLISILVHELGHATMALLFGFSPAITLHGMGGFTSYDPRGYNSDSAGPGVRIPIILAGPGAGFLFAALIYLGLLLAGRTPMIVRDGLMPLVFFAPLKSHLATEVIFLFLYVNIAWGFFNLLPIYPLDGGQLTRIVSMIVSPREGLRASLVLSIVVAVAMAALFWKNSHDLWMPALFGYFAYMNYTEIQARTHRSSW